MREKANPAETRFSSPVDPKRKTSAPASISCGRAFLTSFTSPELVPVTETTTKQFRNCFQIIILVK